jgi:hypothetical protein
VNTLCSQLHIVCATDVSSGLATRVELTQHGRGWNRLLHGVDLFLNLFSHRSTRVLLGCFLNDTICIMLKRQRIEDYGSGLQTVTPWEMCRIWNKPQNYWGQQSSTVSELDMVKQQITNKTEKVYSLQYTKTSNVFLSPILRVRTSAVHPRE